MFNPRIQVWREYFCWANSGTHVVGLTPTGRATVIALRLNKEPHPVLADATRWVSISTGSTTNQTDIISYRLGYAACFSGLHKAAM
ncbi:MAG: hypothetical protein PUP93_27695 [Rhizonema sp. NSF051]|nr:hypothetical protein [Rhizonema sp. NSF051]